MKLWTKTALAAFAAAFLIMPEANAQAICGNGKEMRQNLKEQFREEEVAIGMVNEQMVLSLFVSPAGTWTILVTRTDGASCVVQSGESWMQGEVPAPGEPT